MFNLNIPPTSLLGVDSGGLCSTPKTPEIVNSLIAMTNPLDNYTFTPNNNNNNNCNNNNNNNNNCENSNSNNNQNGGILILHQQKQNFKNNNINNNSANQQLVSQDSSHSSCSGSPLDSPCGTNTTPSVQQTRSQLIKAGLKLSIQSKRKMSSGDSSSGNEQSSSRKYARKSIGDSSITNDGDSSDEEDDSYADIKPSQLGLTPEDEDRRRRRRERNKIAATKCRMKKRERTINLVSESETLETQNVDLKTQVKSLEIERRKLFEMLQNHACVHPGGYQPPTKLLQSPAYKYLKNLGLGNGSGGGDDGDDEDDDDIICNEQQHNQQQQQQQQPRTVIPPVATIKYSRNNGLRQLHQQQQHQQQQQQHNLQDILPNGYCKPSPTTHELGYLSSPTQDLTTCHLQQALNNINNHIQQQQQLHQQQQHHQQHQQQQQQQQIHSPILKTDYIPNCENSNGGTTVDSTTVDFVMKSELAETQSPYTTAKSAERFLCETNFDSFDIKNNSNSFNNHNNNNNNNNINNNNNNNNNCTSHLNNNNTNSIDFHSQLAISCQSYDHILIKNDFLTHDSELLAQLAADGTESEFTDLDTGVSAYVHMTNGGCLA